MAILKTKFSFKVETKLHSQNRQMYFEGYEDR